HADRPAGAHRPRRQGDQGTLCVVRPPCNGGQAPSLCGAWPLLCAALPLWPLLEPSDRWMINVNQGYKIGFLGVADFPEHHFHKPETAEAFDKSFLSSVENPDHLVLTDHGDLAEMITHEALPLALIRRFLAGKIDRRVIHAQARRPLRRLIVLAHGILPTVTI